MTVLGTQPKIALKNILFATDFEVLANRALPFALALADRFGAKLYAAHVIAQEAYAFAHPDAVEHFLKEARDYASCKLKQITVSLQHRGRRCEVLLGEGVAAEVIAGFAATYAVDLLVVGTSSRAGLGKLFIGSVAEQIIRDAPCPVLTVGPHVATEPSAAIESIVYATDFSPGSMRAAEVAVFLAHEYQAHLTLIHVVEGIVWESHHVALQTTKQGLRGLLPAEPELPYETEMVVAFGPVAERILGTATDRSTDLIVIGARGAGAFAETRSRFSSIVHKVVALARCPVLTVGGQHQPQND